MFWSQVLIGKKIATIVSNKTRVLHISSAVLVKHGNSDKILVQLSDNNMRIMIASFLINKVEFVNLNINILLQKGKEYKITIVGGDEAEVHLSGFYKLEEKVEKQKRLSEELKEKDEESDFTRDKSISEDKHFLNTSTEEVDEGVDNEAIEKFLNRKTNKEFDTPRKLEKLPKSTKLQKPITTKTF